MTEVFYIAGTVGVLALAAWLWGRYGERVAGAWVAVVATAIVGIELAKFLLRGPADDLDKLPTEGMHVPNPGIEKQRRELAEALKSGEQRLVEAREDGTTALKAELDRNRRES